MFAAALVRAGLLHRPFARAGTGLSGKALPFSSFTSGLRSRAFDASHPPLPPRPFTPAGVKGSLNTQFGCFGAGEVFLKLDAAVPVCLPRLVNDAVVVNGLGLGARR